MRLAEVSFGPHTDLHDIAVGLGQQEWYLPFDVLSPQHTRTDFILLPERKFRKLFCELSMIWD